MPDLHAVALAAAPLEFRLDGRLVANQIEALDVFALLESQQSTFHNGLGGKVAPHGVNSNSHDPCRWFPRNKRDPELILVSLITTWRPLYLPHEGHTR